MTFKQIMGLDGTGVSFESLYFKGYYLTSQNNQLLLTDGTDQAASTFSVKNRAALQSISVTQRKTTYAINESVRKNHLTVTAQYKDGSEANVTEYEVAAEPEPEPTISPEPSTLPNPTTSPEPSTLPNPATTSVEPSAQSAPIASNAPVIQPEPQMTAPPEKEKEDSGKKVVAKKITLNKKKIKLSVKKQFRLKATILPENTKNKKIIWKSSDKRIATVKNGVVKAKNVGRATITARTANGKKAKCIVIVKK